MFQGTCRGTLVFHRENMRNPTHPVGFGAQEQALRSKGIEAATVLGTGALKRLRHGDVRPEVTEILSQIKMEMKCDLELFPEFGKDSIEIGQWGEKS